MDRRSSAETVVLECRDVGLDDVQDALRGLRLGVAPLWAAGRLPALLEAPENRDAVQVYEELLFDALNQWTAARTAGEGVMTLRLEIPSLVARGVVSLARQLCELMVDEDVMSSVGLPPVPAKTARFTLTMIHHAERVIAASSGESGKA